MDYTHITDLVGRSGAPFRLVEDAEGFPILVVPSGQTRIPMEVWDRAFDDSVVMIVHEDGGAIGAERFIEERRQYDSSMEYEVSRWLNLNSPTVREYLTSDPEQGSSEHSGFVHLHTHSEFSQLDGLATGREIVSTVSERGDPAIGMTDHGNCAVHPELQNLSDEYGIKAVFGMEAYFVPDRHRRSRSWLELDGVEVKAEHLTKDEAKRAERKSDTAEARWAYWHLSLWAQGDKGLRNLWAMSTESYRDGLYDGKARLDWDTLERLNEDVLCGTGCLRGPISSMLVDGDEDGARDALLRLMAIFEGRLYVEIHTNGLEKQQKVNHALVRLAKEYDLPLLAVVDSHYAYPSHRTVHKVWVAMTTNKGLDESGMFEGDQDYHLLDADEVKQALLAQDLDPEVVAEAMSNTVALAERCTAQVRGEITTPTYSKASNDHPDPVARDRQRLIDICLENWRRRIKCRSFSEQDYVERFERELDLLVRKQFCGYFLIVWDYVVWAKRQGCLVGPSRGSGGGSLIAYLMEITEIDPVENNLIFERFLTDGRSSLPDFDIDFPSSWRSRVINYIIERWGEDYTANIGTIGRMRSKQAVNDVVRALKPILPYEIDYRAIEALKSAIEAADAPLAGKHLPWDEFCDQFSDIVDPLRESYPELFAIVDVVVDRVRHFGKHPAGVVVSTESPLTDLPMKLEVSKNGDSAWVTQFDMNALEALGYVKFDILTLRNLDTIQDAVDLIAEAYGKRVNPYEWDEEYEDPQVWESVSSGRTLGLFQVETSSGTDMVKKVRPHSVADLAAAVTIVRPGPWRSGLTDTYLRRRAGIEPVSYPDERMVGFVGDTYGAMIYQEQVMAACMTLAGYTSTEADVVRKLLGKKQVEKVQAAGEEFVSRAVANGTDVDVAAHLWGQMAEFAKYGFGKAHAYAYAVLGAWTGWLKVHFPKHYLLACLSTIDMDRVPEFIEEVRLDGYDIKPPDVNLSGVHFKADGLDIIYGLATVKGIGQPTAERIVEGQPYESVEDFRNRAMAKKPGETTCPVNAGHLRTLVEVGAFDSLVSNRRAVETQLDRDASGESRRCLHLLDRPNPEHPHNLPCGFDWDQEPDPPTIPKGRGKDKVLVAKPPPKRCTVSCRQYTPPPPVQEDEVAPYSRMEIMQREMESLGVWITASPWEQFRQEHLDGSDTASTIEAGETGMEYVGVALVEAIRPRRDQNGNPYAFVTLDMQDGKVDAVCFASLWQDKSRQIQKTSAGVAVLVKKSRGLQLADYSPYH